MVSTVDRGMMNLTIREIGEVLGSIREGDQEFSPAPVMGIDIDSRRIEKGSVFVAVKGERLDGHNYLESAFANGAATAIVNREESSKRELKGDKYIVVDDTIDALGRLAKYYRAKFDIPIIAITGSNGKTTVKNLIYEALSTAGPVLKSEKNFNNQFGLPLSIFKLTEKHKFAVFEMGMSAPGEISYLSSIASPDVAVITNVGPAHLEFFDSVEQIADAKLEIVGGLKASGALIINGDDPLLMKKTENLKRNILRFGLSEGNHIRTENLNFDKQQKSSFSIGNIEIKSDMPGIHNVYNMLAAFAAAHALRIDLSRAATAISKFKSVDMRSEIVENGGVTYILDCYNANPVSMKYAIDLLAAMKSVGRRVAVLGDMLELGKESPSFHRDLGKYARDKEIDMLFCYGKIAFDIAEAFGGKAIYSADKSELASKLSEYIQQGDTVLFKGSRGVALEEIYSMVQGET